MCDGRRIINNFLNVVGGGGGGVGEENSKRLRPSSSASAENLFQEVLKKIKHDKNLWTMNMEMYFAGFFSLLRSQFNVHFICA